VIDELQLAVLGTIAEAQDGILANAEAGFTQTAHHVRCRGHAMDWR